MVNPNAQHPQPARPVPRILLAFLASLRKTFLACACAVTSWNFSVLLYPTEGQANGDYGSRDRPGHVRAIRAD